MSAEQSGTALKIVEIVDFKAIEKTFKFLLQHPTPLIKEIRRG